MQRLVKSAVFQSETQLLCAKDAMLSCEYSLVLVNKPLLHLWTKAINRLATQHRNNNTVLVVCVESANVSSRVVGAQRSAGFT
jgi:hypothetical protein